MALCGLLRRCSGAAVGRRISSVRCTASSSFIVSGQDISTEKSPVVIFHGALGSCTNWRTLSRHFSSRLKAPVYALDAPNHGESPWTDTMSYHSMAQEAVDFFQRQQFDKVRLIGHSMGGKTVMVIALKYPHLVDKLVVVDTSPAVSDGVKAIEGYIKSMRALNFSTIKSRSEVFPALVATIFEKEIGEFLAMNATQDTATKKIRWRCNLDAIEKFLPELAKFPEFDKPCKVETLFIGGNRSQHITAAHHPEIRRLFPNSDIKMIRGGHWVHYDNPSTFVERTVSFLDS